MFSDRSVLVAPGGPGKGAPLDEYSDGRKWFGTRSADTPPSLDQLARQTGRDRRVLTEAGVVLRGRRRVPVADREWVITQYQRGATLREIAEAAGCSHSSRRALLRAGIPLRPQGNRPPSRPGEPG